MAMQLRYEPVELRLRDGWSTSRTRNSRVSRVVVVRLLNGHAEIGLGEAAPISRYGESVDSVISFLEQVDAGRLEVGDTSGNTAYLDSLSSGGSAAKSALNCALLDIAAQRAGQPLHDFLGLGFQEKGYVTSYSIGIDTAKNVQRKVAAADGFPVLKIKLGVQHDRAILEAVRQVAAEKVIRVDANEGWKTRSVALERIEHLAKDGRVELVEQPMPAGTRSEDLVWLKERSPLPLFADESFHTAADVEKCVHCFHGVNVKLSKTAGISGAMTALRAARRAGMKTMLGCMVESSLGITAAAHLAALTDYLDLDGNLLIENDAFEGIRSDHGQLSFAMASQRTGLMVRPRRPV